MSKLSIFIFFISITISAQQDFEWLKIKNYRTSILSDSLKENSGLDFFQDRMITINDSGNSAEIFEIDRHSGKIKATFKTGLKNVDWEAIASDSTHIYIGDFGNNSGTRKDLSVYKISLTDSLDVPIIKNIPFFYPEQLIFDAQNLHNNFDAEAMIVINGKIHIFTKEWVSKGSAHYVIDPLIQERQPAIKIESYKTAFLVTDAAYYKNKLYLVGYTKNTEIFLSIFDESTPGRFFETKPRKYYLGSALSVGQVEGITVNEEGIYISSETFSVPFSKVKPSLYFIPADRLK